MLSDLTPDQRAWYDLMVERHYPPIAIPIAGPMGLRTFVMSGPPQMALVLMQHPMPRGWKKPVDGDQAD